MPAAKTLSISMPEYIEGNPFARDLGQKGQSPRNIEDAKYMAGTKLVIMGAKGGCEQKNMKAIIFCAETRE